MMSPTERYQRDPEFKALVDVLRDQLIRCQFTPTELREAVILAATLFDRTHLRPFLTGPIERDFCICKDPRGKGPCPVHG